MVTQTLFESGGRQPSGLGSRPPLAERLRPRKLEEVVGQRHLIGEQAPLRQMIASGQLHSLLLYGPPGSGKTTLARLLGNRPGHAYEEHSAVAVGLAEVRAVIERATARDRPTVLFLDEIHRFNKAQQDALLPAVERGLITLIGATTENPAFAINRALLSRLTVYVLEPLSKAELLELLAAAVAREAPAVEAEAQALELFAAAAGGDGRVALSALEAALELCDANRPLTVERARAALSRPIAYDRAGDHHYDTASAWIKATRGSDPDASLYYLAVMIEGGEDPRFIARRMVILASEDIGNADPQALAVATAAAQAVELVGLPEATYALAQAAVYLALAPKSNAAGAALARAREQVRSRGALQPPAYLLSAPRPGVHVDQRYDYPHDHPSGVSSQPLLPDGVAGLPFFEPAPTEPQLAARLAEVKRLRERG